MNRQTIEIKELYNQKISFLFTQLICETESLYQKVVKEEYFAIEPENFNLTSLHQIQQNPQPI